MLYLNGFTCLFGALMLLVLPLNWLFAAVSAAIFHELCHILAIYLTGGHVQSLSVGIHGAVIQADIPPGKRELLCAMAGPAGSFLLAACRQWAPKLAVCALIQGLFNLLPVFPMDGGRMVRILLQRWVPSYAAKLERIMGLLSGGMILLLSFCYARNTVPVLILIGTFRWISRKIPCKPCKNRVQ